MGIEANPGCLGGSPPTCFGGSYLGAVGFNWDLPPNDCWTNRLTAS